MLADHFWQGAGEEEAPSPMSKSQVCFTQRQFPEGHYKAEPTCPLCSIRYLS